MESSDSKLSPAKIVFMTRIESSDEGTFGHLRLGKLSFITGELPWRDNQPHLSCIPVGTYKCTFNYSPHLKRRCYEVLNVPNREGIRIHPANVMGHKPRGFRSEVDGCIALGRIKSSINGQKALLKSRDAVSTFEMYLQEKDFTLVISSLILPVERVA